MNFDQEKLKRMLISLSRVLNLVRSQSFENNRSIAIALYSLVFLFLLCPFICMLPKTSTSLLYSRYLVKCC